MTPNPYRAWLLGIAVTLVSLGSILWLVGLSIRNTQASFDPAAGLGEMAIGGDVVQFGLLLLALWLVVSALLYGLQRLQRPAAEDGDGVPATAEKRRIDFGGNVDLR
jgi:hypothetical protein